MNQLVLSLFPGIGLLDMAFEQEGFCVVRGPDVLWGGCIKRFHPPPGKFDGIIGGPPCQEFSSLSHMVRHNGHEPKFGNLIPEFERCVAEAQPQCFLMENVKQAPVPCVPGYDVYSFTLNNRQCLDENGEPAVQNRVRRFSWGWLGEGRPRLNIETALWQNQEFEYAVCGGGQNKYIDGKIVKINSPEAVARARARKSGKPVLLNRDGSPKRREYRLNSAVGGNIKS